MKTFSWVTSIFEYKKNPKVPISYPLMKDTYPCSEFIRDMVSTGLDELNTREVMILMHKVVGIGEAECTELRVKLYKLSGDVRYRILYHTMVRLDFDIGFLTQDLTSYYSSTGRMSYYDCLIGEHNA